LNYIYLFLHKDNFYMIH